MQVVGIVSLPVCFSPLQPITQNLSKAAEQWTTTILLNTRESFCKTFPWWEKQLLDTVPGLHNPSVKFMCLNSTSQSTAPPRARSNCNLGAQPFGRSTRQLWSIPTQKMRTLLRQFLDVRMILSLFSLFSALLASWHPVFHFSSRHWFSLAWSFRVGAVAYLELKTHKEWLAGAPENNLARGWWGHLPRPSPKHYC